jgi:hypothetical protein
VLLLLRSLSRPPDLDGRLRVLAAPTRRVAVLSVPSQATLLPVAARAVAVVPRAEGGVRTVPSGTRVTVLP